ncbi:DUF6443 domain-containing protein [Tenacibaculum finnmarkense]|uniref:DUF6443 domain-containing protein n=1 Tax=Tenacibaculum finnmarkense TaxID=2781243 RepID=UPI001E48BA3B|nr:DUF6443 domain-containing protein [Tenacibaculum finnmarkense]MCD8413257.1 RHS repeat-associated core domain-containing protein [Tenacibaculum finnmarkense genomovar ulcerans]MCG8208227.1 RHS repeat-associated core domain-containing protein [Tenacibaculum finnmarkense genomovar finnmarkense]MCG8724211.1 RHS repeat-associated core domain-containing protein [Tenacibaculum finnmarkense]MCG8742545.1 RHS repeat-associated core domain-containing protein [Tenacibaculum finnmarkense]MCG8765951.1 RH
MKKLLYVLLFVSVALSAQTTTENYVLSKTYKKASTSPITGNDQNKVSTTIQYFDGLGRPKQSISVQAGGNSEDIINHTEYDALGRQVKEYLPYSKATQNGAISTGNIASEIQGYYKAKYPEDFSNVNLPTNSYSEKEFDGSPLNRVLKQAGPGQDWRLNGGHGIEFDYQTNIDGEVTLFGVTTNFSNATYTPTLTGGNDTYLAGQLYKIITKDENYTEVTGKLHTTEEFKNKQGQVVLKRTYALINSIERAHDTYYVYDDYGNLTYVLPPKANSVSSVNTLKNIKNQLNDLCYQYTYDYRNRLVEKQIPGKGKEVIIYDRLDRPVLTQDAIQKSQNKWLFTKYDILGRVVYTGIYTRARYIDRVRMQTHFNNNNVAVKMYETALKITGTLGNYYSNLNFPSTGIEVLTVNYYDDYTFNSLTTATSANYYGIPFTRNTKGLPTGSKVKVLGENKWITTISHYDEKSRPVYVYSKNDYLGTIDISESKLNDFTGILLESRTTHIKSGKTIVTIDSFTYDHMNRLLSQKQCIGDETLTGCGDEANSTNLVLSKKMILNTSKTIVDNNSITLKPGFHVKATLGKSVSFSISEDNAELITSNTYDDLGQLISKKVGNKEASPLQTVDYKYNIRGWLKNINQDSLNDNDLFNFSLKYNDPTSGTTLFNGNISQTSWNTLSQDKSTKTYTYDYDALNRIKSGTGVLGSKYDVSGIKYDKNGNIKTLIRKGHINIDADVFGTMDNLVYSYDNGNKLHSVTDKGNDSYGFKDGNSSDNIYNNRNDDYKYDVNGNMISDANKGITNITYNHLNLPKRVTFNNSNQIEYSYDATGVKQIKTVKEKNGGNTISTQTAYAGNFIYHKLDNGGLLSPDATAPVFKLEFFNHPEGYVSPLDANDLSKGFKYIYQYKDHLGNVRLSYTDNDNNGVIDASSEIVEESNYYPFGLKYKGYNGNVSSLGNSTAQKFGFGGKELNDDLVGGNNLNWHDFGARSYDAALGRWMNLDPLAEKMRRHSPYNYAFNNPIYFIDPDGMKPESTHTDEDGNVIAVFDDGDLGVYKHESKGSEAKKSVTENYSSDNTSANGEKMGKTHTSLGFADFGAYKKDGTVKPGRGAKIDFESNWASEKVGEILKDNPILAKYAMKARGGKDWDIKTKSPNGNVYYGSKLFGKYASARDAGNFAAGAIAQKSLVPNSIINYGFGTYNLSNNNISKSLKMIGSDLLKLSSPTTLGTGLSNMSLKANFGEHPLSKAGIEAGKKNIKNN